MLELITGYIAAANVFARLAFFMGVIIFTIKDKSLWSIMMLLGFLIYVVGSSEMWNIGHAINESKQAGGGYNTDLNDRYQTMLAATTFGFLLAGVSFLIRNIVWIIRDRKNSK
jgi:hypothetical protein